MTRSGPQSPLRSLVNHPFITALLTILGIAAGIVAARALPVTYTAEARLAVVSATNNAYTIPGYPLAARELAADYSRWVQNNASGGTWAPPGSTSVSASPIPESAVIRVEVGAGSEAEAIKGAEQVSQALLKTVAGAQAQHSPQRAFDDFTKQAPAVAVARVEAQQAETAYSRAVGAKATKARIAATARTLRNARVKLSLLELKQNASGDLYRRMYADTQGASTLKQVVPATAVGSPERTALMRFGVLGSAIGLLIALLVAVGLDRRARRQADGSSADLTPSASEASPTASRDESAAPHPSRRDHTTGPARDHRADVDAH